MPRVPRPLALLLSLALAAAAAGAGDREVILRFRDGRLLAGRVVEIREEGVLHESDAGRILWKWADLTLPGAYEARASVLDDDDGAGRLELARWCLRSGLPAEGRTELQRARGLGAGRPEELEALLLACDEDQAETAIAAAEAKADAEDFAGALATLSSWLRSAPPSDFTRKGQELAAELVRRRDAAEERRRLEQEQEKRAAQDGRKDRYVRDALDGADAARTEGARHLLLVVREEDGGALGRLRASAADAERRLLEARQLYDRARRAAGNDRPAEAREAQEGRRTVDGRLLDLYLRLARTFVGQKMWKEAQGALDRALRLDPVNPEGLDLQEKVRENWKKRRLSEITNATGTSSDGTGR
jgi:tetratricopeptide (TPR) repeat protein